MTRDRLDSTAAECGGGGGGRRSGWWNGFTRLCTSGCGGCDHSCRIGSRYPLAIS